MVFILVVFLFQVFISFLLTVSPVLLCFTVSCFVIVMAVLVTNLVLRLISKFKFDLI